MELSRSDAVLVAPRTASQLRLEIRPASVLRFALLMLIVANLGRIPVFSTGDREAPLLINDMAVAFAFGVFALAAVDRRKLLIDRVTVAAIVFAGIGAASAISSVARFGLSGFELFVSLSYLARWSLYFGIYVATINVVRAADAGRVWSGFDAMMVLFAAFGVVQSAFLPGFAQLVYPSSRAFVDWDIQGHRLVSTVLEPNIAGAMLLIAFLVDVSRFATGVRVPRWRPVLLFVALVCTVSRSSALGLIAGIAVILLLRGLSKRVLVFAGVIAAGVLASAPKLIAIAATYGKFDIAGGSAAARVVSWLRAFRILADHPFIGVGFNTVGFVQEQYGWERMGTGAYSIDGGLLFVAVMTGVCGLAVFIYMLAVIARRSLAVWRDLDVPAEHRALALGAIASLVAICVHSVFVNSLLTTFVMEPLWVLWGIVFVVDRERRQRNIDRALAAPIRHVVVVGA
jgi:hypothetical protein